MDNMKVLILLSAIGVIQALHCDKEFNYNDNYGNGFDITCQGITEKHLHILSNITISNEISLTIGNSSLTNITSSLFNSVQHLKCFYLENSTFVFSADQQIFHLLTDLEHLVIKNTSLRITKNTFVGLGSLKDMTLSSNNISKIEKDSFQSFSSLGTLRITHNKIKSVDDIPLCEVRSLRNLNLSSNVIEDLNKQVFYCRNAVDNMNLNVNDQELDVHNKDFYNIRDFALELTNVDLSHNRIKEIGHALSDLKFLRILRLESNLLKRINDVDFELLYFLEELYLSNNSLEIIGSKVFEKKDSLERLDLSFNKLESLNISTLPILQYLNLGYNKIDSLNFINVAALKTLQTLIVSNNKVGIVEANLFQHSPLLETLDLGCNQVILNGESFNGLHELKKLVLKNNSLETLPVNLFKDLIELRVLDLSKNKLKVFENEKTFENLKNLEVLNISYNLIEDVNYELLKPLDNLHVLDIAGNRLKYIEYEAILSNLPLLSMLNIKSNFLPCEFLGKIIKFLRKKSVSYTSSEHFEYEKENVGGIICSNERFLPNSSSFSSVFINLSISVLTIVGVVVVVIGLFKFHVYLKRRKYRADEFELIHE